MVVHMTTQVAYKYYFNITIRYVDIFHLSLNNRDYFLPNTKS